MHFGRNPLLWRRFGALLIASTSVAALFWQLPATARAQADQARIAEPHPLVWDVTERVLQPKPGEHSATFEFTVVNSGGEDVAIEQVRPTCGCTMVEMPASPWVLAPGASGTMVGTIDFRGSRGSLSKAIFVTSRSGVQRLVVTVRVPELDETARRANRQIALQDRQAVFRGECARCHSEPALHLSGSSLFTTACGVCHLSPQRASEVPDLLTARVPRDEDYWTRWITEGKPGTMMPAWGKEHGGPLTTEQIRSLVDFALRTLPTQPRIEQPTPASSP